MRLRKGVLSTNQFNLQVSTVDILLTVLAFLSSMIVVTNFQADLEHALIALAYGVFCIGGMVFGLLSFGVQRDRTTTTGEVLERVNYGLMGFIVIAFIELAVGALDFFAVVELYDVLFLFTAAVAETWLFHYFLLILLYRLSPPSPTAMRMLFVSGMNAALFAAYHAVVYDGRPDALVIVFLGGVILALVNLITQSVTPAMIAHTLKNVPLIALLIALIPP